LHCFFRAIHKAAVVVGLEIEKGLLFMAIESLIGIGSGSGLLAIGLAPLVGSCWY